MRDKLYAIDTELFKSQFLYNLVYFEDIDKKLESTTGESLKKEIFQLVREKKK